MPDIYDMELDARPDLDIIKKTDEISQKIRKPIIPECEHKDIEQREEFYGLQPTQYHTYFACADCGLTITEENE